MDRIQNKSQNIIYNLVYIAFVFVLVYQFGLGINLDLSLPLQLIFVSLASMVVKAFFLNPLILYILLAIGFLAGLIINHYITPFLLPLLERIYYLINNIFQNLMGNENIADENLLLYWGILLVLTSLFNAYILFKNKNIYLLLPIYIGSFLFYWYTFYDQSYWAISIFFIGFFILMGLDRFSKEIFKLEKNVNVNTNRLYYPWMQTVTKYSALIVILAMLLPKNYNYIEWPWLQHKVYSRFPFVEDLRSYDAYTRSTGDASLFNFSMTESTNGSSRLGGPVNLSDKKIMTVYSSEGNYLRGNVQQTYTGTGWQSISTPSRYYSLRENFSDWSEDGMEAYYEYINLIVQNHDFASTTLFSPYKAAFVDFEDKSDIVLKRDNVLEFPHGIYDGESYNIWAQKPLPYGVLISRGINLTKDIIDDLDIYLQLPEDKITTRTRDLLKEIVKESKSDYNKAIAIESHLRSNFEYNLYPDEVPQGYEFIDHFLFESQEGYCTYYATAMAIMLRLEGIPSRYVEGYLAMESIDDGVYEVRHDNAHAWVEAFVEPVGWMQFEPTPAFPMPIRLEDYQRENLNETPVDAIINNNGSNQNGIDDLPEITDDSDLGFNREVLENHEPNVKDIGINKIIFIPIIGFILLLPIRYLIGFYKYKSKESRMTMLTPDKRVIYLYGQIVNLIGLIDYPQLNGETHYEYAERIGYKFYDPSKDGVKTFKEITDIFIRNKYGNKTMDEDILILEEYRRKLEIRLKNKLGVLKYYYNKYIKFNL